MQHVRVGRYTLFGEIASGGMATVHYGRQLGSAGFQRIVAVKRLHPHLGKDDEFRNMFLDEARIAARIHHPNAASILDVVSLPDGELMIVMEYIAGESLSRLLRRVREDSDLVPPAVASAIMCDVLQGLHAAHEAKNEAGEALGIIHRDVSPHNVLVGADGITRIVDFGIAKARGRIHATREGQVKGKLAYMPPEQLRGQGIDRRCDIFATGVVLWEALTARRLFSADSEGETVTNVLERAVTPPSEIVKTIPPALDAVVMRALARDPAKRFATARDMATAIEGALVVGSARAVGTWIQTVSGEVIAERAAVVAKLEQSAEVGLETTDDHHPREVGSQISSVSVSTDARSPKKRRTAYVALASVLLVACAIALAMVKLTRHTATPATPTSTSLATETARAEPTEAIVAASTAPVPIITETPRIAGRDSGAPMHHRVPAATVSAPKIETAAPVASEKCPIKTYTDQDGIVKFRRVCDP